MLRSLDPGFKARRAVQMSGTYIDNQTHKHPMIAVLTPIWERVLQRSPIGAEDDFFDLGGDASLAACLFMEIAQATGRVLPIAMIYEASTIARLAAATEKAGVSRISTLVPLKPGTDTSPVFIAHGLGGNVTDVARLAQHIRSRHPIYGLQASGLDGVREPLERIEDMAQFNLDAIRELQPRGPYLLIGYSLGGLVTLEMAQRLSQSGEEVALLALLETYPHRRFLPLACRARVLARLARHHGSAMTQLPLRKAIPYVIHRSERLWEFFRPGRDYPLGQRSPAGVSLPSAAQRVRDSSYVALANYRPRFYSGKVRFVRAEVSLHFPADPTAVWAQLAEEFEVETVPGDHAEILTTHFESLAAVLSRYLQESVGST